MLNYNISNILKIHGSSYEVVQKSIYLIGHKSIKKVIINKTLGDIFKLPSSRIVEKYKIQRSKVLKTYELLYQLF